LIFAKIIKKKESQIQEKINLDLSFCLADNGFSLDELLVKLGELFENRGYSEVLKLILQLVKEILIWRISNGKEQPVKCCGDSMEKEQTEIP